MEKKVLVGFIEDLLLNVFRVFKDEEYQKRIWFRREGPEVGSYLETVVHFIGEVESIFKDPKCQEYLGEENYSLLSHAYDLVKEHLDLTEERLEDADLLQENELLNDPKWHDIQTLSEELYDKLTEFVSRQSSE